LGPAEKLLASHTEIGENTPAAEELRKHHEQLEMKCTDSYGTYAELRHKVTEVATESRRAETSVGGEGRQSQSVVSDLEAQRDYMDTVCRSFAQRLERRRNLVITSVRFHRLVDEVRVNLLSFICFVYEWQ